jgi:hypothetical protein
LLKLLGALSAAVLTVSGLTASAMADTPEPTTVTLVPPTVTQVPLGAEVPLDGVVSGGPGRTARLELLTGAGWLPLTETTTDDAGAYSLPAPTGWYLRGALRVAVPETTSSLGAVSGQVDLSVLPTYAPRGSTSDWRRTVPGVHWDPCGGTITWKVNQAGVPDRRIAELRTAVRTLHEATGLEFSYAGQTSAVPYRTDGRGSTTSDAAMTIAFATAKQAKGLAGTVVGQGGMTYRSTGQVVRGLVVLDKAAGLTAGFGTGHTWGTLMLHELGHAVGLGHASGREQAMHSGITDRSRGSYQAGDLTGLRKLGTAAGCFAAPLARSLGVTHTVSAH